MDTVVKEKQLRNPYEDATLYISALLKESNNHLLQDLGNPDMARRYVLLANSEGRIRAWYDKEGRLVGLLMFSIGQLWWSNAYIIFEETLFTIDKNYSGLQSEGMKELERIARSYNAKLIATGTLLSEGDTAKLVRNGYMRRGKYDKEYSMFFKKVRQE